MGKMAVCICFSFKPERQRAFFRGARTHTRNTHTNWKHAHLSEATMEATGTMEECRERKEQSPYLGRPSSGVPDLKGKQEHSQQRVKGSWEAVGSEHAGIFKTEFQMSVVTLGLCRVGGERVEQGQRGRGAGGEGVHRQGRPDEH